MLKHKSTAAYDVRNYWSGYQDITNEWEHYHIPYSGYRDMRLGANIIDYDDGPRYLRLEGRKYCNWKYCEHTRGLRYIGNNLDAKTSYTSPYGPTTYEFSFYNIPWMQYSDYDWQNCPAPPTPTGVVSELMDKLYADMAGRAQSYLLSLEDLAGFFSGRSLIKSIRSVADATHKVQRAISICTRLRGEFKSSRKSIYDCWVKSKDLVQRIVGLHLGYRFSFKTTLRDVDEAVTWSSGYATYLRSILYRNTQEYLRYEKSDYVAESEETQYSASETNQRVLASFPQRGALTFFWDEESSPSSRRVWMAGHRVKAFARARVRYPTDFATFKHYFEGRAGLDKPLTTAWAIVPLSFVIDYLFNVQDSLVVLDNKLNDYLVSMQITQPWVGRSTFRKVFASAGPYRSGAYLYNNPNYPWSLSFSELSGTSEISDDYRRDAIFGSQVSAQFPPLIGGSNNWTQHVKTGIELLVSR